MTIDLRKRLLSKVKIDEDTRCWNWEAAKQKRGYGFIKIKGRMKYVHRVSYELHCGEIPDGMYVCHRCDNPACLNPSHLFLGTPAENIADMTTKHRQARGERVNKAKLTETDIISIRDAKGFLQRELAEKYGVTQVQISSILRRKCWTHVRAK